MRSEQSAIGIQRSMWLAAKDLVKLNEGEVKERVHTLVGRLFRQLR
jgi:hypothetical protein